MVIFNRLIKICANKIRHIQYMGQILVFGNVGWGGPVIRHPAGHQERPTTIDYNLQTIKHLVWECQKIKLPDTIPMTTGIPWDPMYSHSHAHL